MELIKFLDHLRKGNGISFLKQYKTICFCSESYPLLFFYFLFEKLKKDGLSIKKVNTLDDNLLRDLDHSFLGKNFFYWLGNISFLDIKSKKKWLNYIENYNGPNYIVFFLEDVKIDKVNLSVQMPKQLDFQGASALYLFFNLFDFKKSYKFIRKLFEHSDILSLDAACLIMHYIILIGLKYNLFFKDWINKLLPSDNLFFQLSKFLFQKNRKLFFLKMQSMHSQFPEIFWVGFWSEQLWRAYYFKKYYSKGQFAEAKRIGVKLPFSFKNNDWRNYSLLELRNAHNFLYKIDFTLKNSNSSNFYLYVFYLKFFLNQFEK